MPKIVDCRHLVDAEPSDGSTHYIFDDSVDVLETHSDRTFVTLIHGTGSVSLVGISYIPNLIMALEKIQADFKAK
jgi:hypothetical protein